MTAATGTREVFATRAGFLLAAAIDRYVLI